MTMIGNEKKDEIEELLDRSDKIKRSDLNIRIRMGNYDGELAIVEMRDLAKILGCTDESNIRVKLNKLGYRITYSWSKWYFARDKKIGDEIENEDKLCLKNLEDEINKLEDELSKMRILPGGKVCRLLNLRRIYNLRKGDKESLLLGDSFTEQLTFCKINKYEDIRLGLKLLFDN